MINSGLSHDFENSFLKCFVERFAQELRKKYGLQEIGLGQRYQYWPMNNETKMLQKVKKRKGSNIPKSLLDNMKSQSRLFEAPVCDWYQSLWGTWRTSAFSNIASGNLAML